MTHYQSTSIPPHNLQNQESSNAIDSVEEIRTKEPFLKRILIVDDEPDVTLTFGVGLEGYYYYQDNERRRFEVHSYNDPEVALSEFKLNFYDLLLTDVYMPRMNGFELCQKIVEKDLNIKVCFMSSAEVNIDALREVYPKLSFGCFIKKPLQLNIWRKGCWQSWINNSNGSNNNIYLRQYEPSTRTYANCNNCLLCIFI